MHLGSSRCEGTIGNMLGCRGANRPVIDLPGYIPGESIVVIDLAQLAAQTDLSDGIISECQSGPAESACADPFDSLGIDFASGANHSPAAVFVSE
jgi:hypothetical protein